MDINESIKNVEKFIDDPTKGLPDEVFLFVSRITPMVNVDLLIKDEKNRILLAWRDDGLCGKGWHIPGGIIRFKQSLEESIEMTSIREIGTIVGYNPVPINVQTFIKEKEVNRGHFISLLFECLLPSDYVLPNGNMSEADPGYLKWYNECPKDFLKVQSVYKKYFK